MSHLKGKLCSFKQIKGEVHRFKSLHFEDSYAICSFPKRPPGAAVDRREEGVLSSPELPAECFLALSCAQRNGPAPVHLEARNKSCPQVSNVQGAVVGFLNIPETSGEEASPLSSGNAKELQAS